MSGVPAPPLIVEKEMAVTRDEFLRTLPRALGTDAYAVDGSRVVLEDAGRRLEITLTERPVRRIAGLALPVTGVRLAFAGYGAAEAERALARFERHFQRGGG